MLGVARITTFTVLVVSEKGELAVVPLSLSLYRITEFCRPLLHIMALEPGTVPHRTQIEQPRPSSSYPSDPTFGLEEPVREDPVWTAAFYFFLLFASSLDESYADRLLIVDLFEIFCFCPSAYIHIHFDLATKPSVLPSLRLPLSTPVLSTQTRVYQTFLGTQLYAERSNPSTNALVNKSPSFYSVP